MKKGNGMYPRLRVRAKELRMNYDDIAQEMTYRRGQLFPDVEEAPMTASKVAVRFQGKKPWTIMEGVVLCDVLGIPREKMLEEFFSIPSCTNQSYHKRTRKAVGA